MPMFALLFGQFTDAFGNPDKSRFIPTIEDLALKFLYLGLGESTLLCPHLHIIPFLSQPRHFNSSVW